MITACAGNALTQEGTARKATSQRELGAFPLSPWCVRRGELLKAVLKVSTGFDMQTYKHTLPIAAAGSPSQAAVAGESTLEQSLCAFLVMLEYEGNLEAGCLVRVLITLS